MENLEGEANFSFGVAVAFTLNYIIGTGFLTLPWGFNQTGNILGIVVLGIITVFAMSAVLMILEVMARAEAYANQANNYGSFLPTHSNAGYKSIQPISTVNDSQDFTSLKATKTDNSLLPKKSRSRDGLHVVGKQKFEVTELCKIFMGKQSVRVYTFLISVYMYGTLWAYSTVFGNSLATRMPLTPLVGKDVTQNSTSYGLYLLIFSMVVVPCSLLELSEQVFIQVALSVCRVLMLVLMIGTIVCVEHESKNQPFGPFTRIEDPSVPASNSISSIHINKMYLLLPMAAYATIFHHSIPSISQPVKNKLQLGWIFSLTLIVCFIGYSVMSVVISNYFGNNTMVSSNLNWEFYWGKLNSDREIPLYARCISSFVVLLPALDVASAFPLNAITLGNSLMSAYYGSKIHVLGVAELKRSRAIFRIVAAVPPLFAASLVTDLGTITHFSGVSGFAIAFIIPSLLAIFSQKLLTTNGLSIKTQYSCWLTSRIACIVSIVVGTSLIVFVVTSLTVMGPPPAS